MAATTIGAAPRRAPAGWTVPVAVAVALLAASVGVLGAIGAATDDGDVVGTGAPGPADGPANQPVAAPVDGHDHGHGPGSESDAAYADLPPEVQAQVDVAREIARRYPTAADAEAGGWRKATVSLAGIGAHYLKGGVGGFAATDGGFVLEEPEILLYDGEGPDAPIAGVSYLVAGDDPEGFVGDFDVWHRHRGVCFAGGLVIAEIDGHEGSEITMTEDQCRAEGGITFPIENLTMLHVWVGEGYEDGAPIFAHDHPMLY